MCVCIGRGIDVEPLHVSERVHGHLTFTLLLQALASSLYR